MLSSIRGLARTSVRLNRFSLRLCDNHTGFRPLAPRATQAGWNKGGSRLLTSSAIRQQEVEAASHDESGEHVHSGVRAKKLPLMCPGCGAPSQTIEPESPGFYTEKRVRVKTSQQQKEDSIFSNALQSGLLSIDLPANTETQPPPAAPSTPICDRCHNLVHQSKGTGIIHPSMQSIQAIIEDSPHRHNHIYHVLDAVDFPMSLIPNLTTALDLPRLRTQNRRSKSLRYIRGRVAEVSFIITRSDLLAPQKEQVDRLVPYLRDVLRDALGRSGRNVRLGNVRCVSAHRGWWTPTLKQEIWQRGGAGFMVGKVNVGKSALYQTVFPKGRNNEVDADITRMRQAEQSKLLSEQVKMLEESKEEAKTSFRPFQEGENENTADFASSPGELAEAQASEVNTFQESELELSDEEQQIEDDTFFNEDEDSLLPPAQPETAYPHMPLVSSLPGTTASPIRIPYGNGKGELIDLPGIHRSTLSTFIRPENHKELVMKTRVVPQQHVLKPGQSLLLGGVVRITPKLREGEELIFLAYPFVPLESHVTSTDKAIAIQTGSYAETGEVYSGTVSTITTAEAKQSIASAGTFKLEWDVTKRSAGPLTASAAANIKAANLPFIVYSADILLEGVGWIELSCQVRRRRESFLARDEVVPEVEVWTPKGEFVACRRPMGAWALGGPKKVPVHKRRGRPRMSVDFRRRVEGGRKGSLKKAVEMEGG